MHIVFVLLSPTFGMHQYTSDPTNTMGRAGHEVHLITTATLPRNRYSPQVRLCLPFSSPDTGFSQAGARLDNLSKVRKILHCLAPDVVHFTGVHLWNIPLLWSLRRAGVPTIHTLHDLDPHASVRFGWLIRLWNRLAIRAADHLLVHGQVYRQRLLHQGCRPQQVTALPLVHTCLSYEAARRLEESPPAPVYGDWALFFGRLEVYKGIPDLLMAVAQLARAERQNDLRLILAGEGDLVRLWPHPLPSGVEVRNRRIDDEESWSLFARCGVVVLPYVSATQSALAAMAYAFAKPVIVTRSGALPEYVEEGRTGWIAPPGDPSALAACLEEALADPERLAVMGQAGRAWYYAWREQARADLVEMYERVRPMG